MSCEGRRRVVQSVAIKAEKSEGGEQQEGMQGEGEEEEVGDW